MKTVDELTYDVDKRKRDNFNESVKKYKIIVKNIYTAIIFILKSNDDIYKAVKSYIETDKKFKLKFNRCSFTFNINKHTGDVYVDKIICCNPSAGGTNEFIPYEETLLSDTLLDNETFESCIVEFFNKYYGIIKEDVLTIDGNRIDLEVFIERLNYAIYYNHIKDFEILNISYDLFKGSEYAAKLDLTEIVEIETELFKIFNN